MRRLLWGILGRTLEGGGTLLCPAHWMTPGAVWVQVRPPHCPIQANPAPLCPSLGLLPLCTMNRPIVPAVSARPPFIMD